MEKKEKPRGSIKRRIIIIICSAILIMIFVGVTLAYVFGYGLLHDVIGRQHVQISQLLGVYINTSLGGEVEDAKVYTTRSLWKDAVIESNSKYGSMSPEAIEKKLLDMDKAWIPAGKDSALLKEYLGNRISLGMRDILKTRGNISELFITDRYGGLVASSGKTSDFYQADEAWWQEAYNNGKGNIFVGDVEFDESSASWVVPIAVPIKDADGNVIGVFKDCINLYRFFSTLGAFRIGKSGHAILTDAKGDILYHHDLEPTKTRLCSREEMKKLLSKKDKFFAFRNPQFHEKNAFVAYSIITPPYLTEKAINWVIFIVQDQEETFDPLYRFIGEFAFVAIFLILIAIPVGAFFGGLIARPIRELHRATEHIQAGDWDYQIDIKTGDEIEQFADTFRDMINNIRDKQKQLQSFSLGLEEKVKERTKELTESQEATMNILEDLQETKDNLERTNAELKQLDKLKSEFVSTVSHELRTPLSIIKEGVSLVLDKIPGDINEKQAKILDISKFNIDRLTRIIDSLLDIAKIEAGKVELKRNLINIADIVRQVAVSFERKIKERALELRLDIDNNAGSVYADPDRITQVLTNLIGNAIKFTLAGSIEVSCKGKDDNVVCSVADTGVGITKSDLPKLFDKFQQFGRLAGAGERGTGLGLSIVKGIIDMHNGAISVESDIGRGSRFTFTLRRYTEQSLWSEFVSKAIDNAHNNKSRVSILIISVKTKEGLKDELWLKNFHNIMFDCARAIKNALRYKGDDLLINDGQIVVILTDCDKEHALLVRQRVEMIMDKCLNEKKIKDKINARYGCATFPEDAGTDTELINKANASVAVG